MLKKLGIGCGGLLALLIVIVVIVSLSGGGDGNGGGSSSDATATPPLAVDATQVWDDYQENETRANATYKERQLLVTLAVIDEIESAGKVQMDMGGFGDYIELDFRDDNDVLELNPGQSITAVCQLDGFQMDTWLEFSDCRWPNRAWIGSDGQ